MIAAAASTASVSPTLTRIAVIAIAVLVAAIVVELVRRRRMMEQRRQTPSLASMMGSVGQPVRSPAVPARSAGRLRHRPAAAEKG